MSMWQINFLLLFSVLLACGERKPIEKFKGSYPIEEIEYDSPRIEVIPAKGATLEDFVHINLLKPFKPGIIGNKAKKIFGEPDQENRGEYESIYEYWSDTARVEVHFGEDIFPSIEIFLKDKNIDNFLIPECRFLPC